MRQGEFNRALCAFDQGEPMRSQLYYRAMDMICSGFVIEAHLLILATWNFARFRYVTKTFDLVTYQKAIDRVTDILEPFKTLGLMDVDLCSHEHVIVDSFNILSSIKGVENTGAAKILHLLCPSIFVMWDNYIAGHKYPRQLYEDLDIVQSGFWPSRQFPKSGLGYHEFLVFCQERFRGLASPDPRKTLAKCIDEFNFAKITYPISQRLKR
jgi:hypothetical protein